MHSSQCCRQIDVGFGGIFPTAGVPGSAASCADEREIHLQGERLQPSGAALGGEAFLELLPPQMLGQGFSRPCSHAHDNLLSCGASFLLLSTLFGSPSQRLSFILGPDLVFL